MPLYYRKMVDGKAVVYEVDINELKPIRVAQPASVEPTQSKTKYFCTVCKPERAFRGIGVMSMHFAKVHQDLREDRETYKKYMRTDATL